MLPVCITRASVRTLIILRSKQAITLVAFVLFVKAIIKTTLVLKPNKQKANKQKANMIKN